MTLSWILTISYKFKKYFNFVFMIFTYIYLRHMFSMICSTCNRSGLVIQKGWRPPVGVHDWDMDPSHKSGNKTINHVSGSLTERGDPRSAITWANAKLNVVGSFHISLITSIGMEIFFKILFFLLNWLEIFECIILWQFTSLQMLTLYVFANLALWITVYGIK